VTAALCDGCGRLAGSRDPWCLACGRPLPGRDAEPAVATPPGWLLASERGAGAPVFEPLPAVPVRAADPLVAPRRSDWPSDAAADASDPLGLGAAPARDTSSRGRPTAHGASGSHGASDTSGAETASPGADFSSSPRATEAPESTHPEPGTLPFPAPAWRVRESPRTVASLARARTYTPALATAQTEAATAESPPLRALFLPLLALVLTSAAAAVVLLVLHVLRDR
jgi:hypothetical protein